MPKRAKKQDKAAKKSKVKKDTVPKTVPSRRKGDVFTQAVYCPSCSRPLTMGAESCNCGWESAT